MVNHPNGSQEYYLITNDDTTKPCMMIQRREDPVDTVALDILGFDHSTVSQMIV